MQPLINEDRLQNFMFDNHPVRGAWARLHTTYQEILGQHHYPTTIAKLLGEAVLAATLLYSRVKRQGCFTVQFQGTGDLRLLSVRCTQDYQVRGYANWQGLRSTTKNLREALDQGQLTITFEPNEGPGRYQSIVPVQGTSIAEAMEAYFNQSEQLPTKLVFAITDTHAAGLMLQAMPEAQEQRDISWQHVTTLADSLSAQELLTTDNATLLHRLYHQEDVRVFDSEPIHFQCQCSLEKMENILRFAGREEVYSILHEHGIVEVTCDFCGNQYTFHEDDVEKIFADTGHDHGLQPGSTLVH